MLIQVVFLFPIPNMNIHTYSVHFIKKSGQLAQVGINKVYQKVLSGFMTQFWSQSVSSKD